jgi:hypothetical protein
MKKQNLNKLVFAKTNIVELNDRQLYSVNGGTSQAATSSISCAKAIAFIVVSSVVCLAN